MSLRARSLRSQLLLLGLAATVLPLAALMAVFVATASSEEVSRGADGELVISTSTWGVHASVAFAAVGLAFLAAAAAWWWSARAVRPIERVTALADGIQRGSLDERIAFDGEAREVQELGDSFDLMLDRLEQASRTEQQLVENASHELRTPLAALAVNHEIIRNNPTATAADHEASLDRSEALVARMQLSIDELLHGARARTQQLRQVDNELMAIVRRVADEQRAVNAGVAVDVDGPEELRLAIDGPSIERALANLVDNAARFTPDGMSVEIAVIDGDPTTVSVTDHGPGIAPDQLPHVFDRYYRAGDGAGHGIGLSLVKQVAEAHGSVAVESPPPGRAVGARFTIEIRR